MANDPKKVWSNDPKVSDFPHLNAEDVRRYELDLKAGRLSTNGTKEDHDAAMEALKAMREWEDEFAGIGEDAPTAEQLAAAKAAAAPQPAPVRAVRAAALTLTQLLDKFLALKKGVSQATITDYTATVKQFDEFAGKPLLADVTDQHVTDYMLWLSNLGNTERTIDKKVGTVRALFNFAKKHKLYDGENPAAERNLLTKKQRTEAGSKFYQLDDVKAIYDNSQFKAFKQAQPNFHLIAIAGLITGARVSALATIMPADLRVSHNDVPYIRVRKDKTSAGARDIPVPRRFFDSLKAYLDAQGDMGFKLRADGKGASDPVRKLWDAHLEAAGLTHEGYTFHGLRKTLNNFLKEQEIDFEVRCQFVGHEFEHVNNTIYSRKKSLDEVAKHVIPAQEKLLDLIRFE